MEQYKTLAKTLPCACSVTREEELENILQGRFEGRINVSSSCAHLLFSLICSLADGFTVFTDHIFILNCERGNCD